MIKTPLYVEMYSPAHPFNTKIFSTTSSTVHSSFSKTASSGCISMAESTSHSEYASASAEGWGASGEVSGSNSGSSSNNSSNSNENASGVNSSSSTTTAFMTEYLLHPKGCFRIGQDGMSLTEDAIRAIVSMDNVREATDCLITYGTHMPVAKQTVGGIFSRTITMTSKTEVSSVSLFAAAGATLQTEKASSVEGSASASYSGFGASASVTAGFSKSSVSGKTEVSFQSAQDGNSEQESECFYSVNVSSLGPNATYMEDFFNQVENNPGTWALIDRGSLEQVIPIWSLIESNLLPRQDGKKKTQDMLRAEIIMRDLW